ncbi:hypothetical protein OsJ_10109 [Oryza sativa Japonica Group]|uniref:Thaumatin-like protein n=1 Tax=Oryza sativa subsp. japonica TaxID=39947 RepID=A3AG02_ORYSJ|nr:hypothetical protein OsJ_10109 [Oryza sativa Japonica Group]
MMGIQRICIVLGMLFILVREGGAVTFTFVNRCTGTVWPGILSNAGSARMDPTGFELPPGAARAVPAPTGWSGRLWARTGCTQDGTGKVVCATGDCGSGTLECAGRGAAPPGHAGGVHARRRRPQRLLRRQPRGRVKTALAC